ncbi:MAG: Uncharacterized protein G01um101493_238 [Microgenomates group bacterium Gr01-1014_93]|nr:MAG: Uncharacterized protein G01um101493_238 [Microgenomates group bacterium Gr01-1014_93]
MKREKVINFYLKYKLVVYPFAVGLASITLILLVIIPQLKGYFSSKEDGQVTQNRLKILESKAVELENISDDDLTRRLQSAIVALPIEKDYTVIIGLLQKMSAEAGVSLKSIILDTGGSKDAGGGASSFSVRIESTSTKFGFDEFLKKIDNSSAVLKIGSLSTDVVSDDLVSASLILDVYYSPTPKILGSVDSPLPKLTEEEEALAEKLSARLVIAPVTSGASGQPANILPRGKANPFE